MKKLLVFALLALGMTAYAQKEEVKPVEAPVVVEAPVAEEAVVAQPEVLTFTKENGKEDIVVESSDKFETATITIGSKKYETKRVVSGSGIKMETEDKKVSIHFAKGEGVLAEDGKEAMITEKKSK